MDWPDDVVELADALGIDRFAVSGWSFGGPYVATCTFKIPDRLTAAGLIASRAPLVRPGATQGMMWPGRMNLWLAKHAPWLVKPIIWQMGEYYANTIPDCNATFYPGEGHFIFFNHGEEILEKLIS
ncbi:MAG: alpha/beta fold hydrolase [Candidatus Bipolaricaulia bacterium]